MSTTSKSPRRVLLVAYEAGRRSLPTYAHRFAPKKFTQPQLLALLVLKAHLRQDYRGVRQVLIDSPELGEAIGLLAVPHWTTLQKAAARLLTSARARRLLDETVALAQEAGVVKPRGRVSHAAADSTGFDTRHVSHYFLWRTHRTRQGKQPPPACRL